MMQHVAAIHRKEANRPYPTDNVANRERRAVGRDDEFGFGGNADTFAVRQEIAHLAGRAGAIIADIERVDAKNLLAVLGQLFQKEKRTAVIDSDLCEAAREFRALLPLKQRKEYQGVRRIEIALQASKVAEDKVFDFGQSHPRNGSCIWVHRRVRDTPRNNARVAVLFPRSPWAPRHLDCSNRRIALVPARE